MKDEGSSRGGMGMNQSSASDLTSIDCTGASAEVVLMYCGTEVERDEGSASQGCARVVLSRRYSNGSYRSYSKFGYL